MRGVTSWAGSQRAVLIAVITLWVIAVLAGMKFILDYQSRSGAPARPPATLPAVSWSSPERANLVLIAHPRCPCTRATLSELERLMARTGERLDACVLLAVPPGLDTSWARGDLWRTASKIPRVRVLMDPEGHEAKRFGALTSGQALLYDAGGQLLFAGGITAGRGHAGDNAGSDAVVALAMHGGGSPPSVTPVYGCEIAPPSAGSKGEGPSCPK